MSPSSALMLEVILHCATNQTTYIQIAVKTCNLASCDSYYMNLVVDFKFKFRISVSSKRTVHVIVTINQFENISIDLSVLL